MDRTTIVREDKPTASRNEETTDLEGASSTKTYLKSGAGVLFALLNTALIASAAQFMALSSKAGMPGFQLLFLAKLVQLIVVIALMPFFRTKLTTEDRRQTFLLTLTTVTDNLSTILEYISLVYVLPGIVYGIMRGSLPVAAACIGFLCLKETVGVVDCLGIVLSVTGVIVVAFGMITESTSSTKRLTKSILLPFAAAFSKAPNTVLQRSLFGFQGVSILTANFYINLLGAVVLLALTYSFETPRWTMSTQTIGYVIGLCVCDIGGMFTEQLALKTEKAGITAGIQAFTIPLAVLLDYLIHSAFPSPLKFGGVVLIVVGTGVVTVYTWRTHRQEILRKKFLESLDFDK